MPDKNKSQPISKSNIRLNFADESDRSPSISAEGRDEDWNSEVVVRSRSASVENHDPDSVSANARRRSASVASAVKSTIVDRAFSGSLVSLDRELVVRLTDEINAALSAVPPARFHSLEGAGRSDAVETSSARESEDENETIRTSAVERPCPPDAGAPSARDWRSSVAVRNYAEREPGPVSRTEEPSSAPIDDGFPFSTPLLPRRVPASPAIIVNENFQSTAGRSRPIPTESETLQHRQLPRQQFLSLPTPSRRAVVLPRPQKIRPTSTSRLADEVVEGPTEATSLLESDDGEPLRKKRTNSVDSITSKIVAMVEPRVKGRDSPFKHRETPFRQLKENDEDYNLERDDIIKERKDFMGGLGGQRSVRNESENPAVVSKVLENELGNAAKFTRSEMKPSQPASSSPVRFDEEDFLCGFFGCRPSFLKPLVSPLVFLPLFSLLAFCQGMIVNGLINVNVSTLERRFQLSSAQLGIVCGAYDFFNVLVGIPVAFIGARGNKPLFISLSAVALAVGAFLFSLPHFITGQYQYNSFGLLPPTCNHEIRLDECSFELESKNDLSHLQHFFYLFLLSQAFNALGGGILYTVGLSFLHESVNPAESPVYIGIFYGVGGIGPAAGYLLGGHFLDIFVDVDKPSAMGDFRSHGGDHLTTSDPRWCGAWWIGFTVSMFIALGLAFPLAAFPRHLRRTKELVRVDETNAVLDRSLTHAVLTTDKMTSTSTPKAENKDSSDRDDPTFREGAAAIRDCAANAIATGSVEISFEGENYLASLKDKDNNEYFIVVDPPGQQYSARKRGKMGRKTLDLSSIGAISAGLKGNRKKKSSKLSSTKPIDEATSRHSPTNAFPISVVAPFVSSSIKQNLTLATYSPEKRNPEEGSPPSWRQLGVELKLLLRNPVFVLISLSLAADLFLLNGYAAFMPKFIQHRFSLTASYAAMLMGGTLVAAVTVGLLLGGISVKCRNLRVGGMLVQNVFMGFLCCWFLGVLWIRCEKNHLVGVTGGRDGRGPSPVRLENPCNRGCGCPRQYYEPVCDPSEKVQYFSACHAGCKTETREYGGGGHFTVYEDCSCMKRANLSGGFAKFQNKVVAGPCNPPSCPLMWVAIAGMFLFLFCHSFCTVPSTEIVISCVPKEVHAVALATYRNIGFLLGSIISPFIFGLVIDAICLLWQTSPCKEGFKGACWIYDDDQFALAMFILGMTSKVLSVFFQCIALAYSSCGPDFRPRHDPDISLGVVNNR